MQLAGYRHVIATQWSITDTHAPGVADMIYTELTVTDHPDTARVAIAVHHAVAALRAREPFRPDLWATLADAGGQSAPLLIDGYALPVQRPSQPRHSGIGQPPS